MKKFSTTFLVFALIAALNLLAGCKGSPDNNATYDSSYYNVSMKEALIASQSFVNQSVKSQAGRNAFVDLSDDDKWQGYITNNYGNNWNVPSNIYGTSLTTADNTLVINGEDLGTLQELTFHKDSNGNFTRAVFEYKGYSYYVFDKEQYVKNASYIVLASEDDGDHIYFDQEGKTYTKDWSNFKIWEWCKAGDNNLYRTGNLGYAYTIRNFKMQDGSYATVTVSGFNYYNYGFRVWIKETDGKTVKKNYPAKTSENTEGAYQPSLIPASCFTETPDFVYEIVNNTSGTLIVQNYLRDWNIDDYDLSIISVSEEKEIPQGGTYQFKYNLDELKKQSDSNNYGLGCFFTPEGKWRCGGWENSLNQPGRKHTVTVTDSQQACMDGENSWSDL